MNKIIYIGYIYSEQLLGLVEKWGSRISPAAFKFQKAFLKGLDQNGYDYQIISIPLVETFPKIPKLFFSTSLFSWSTKENNFMLGMVNLPIVRMFSWSRRLTRVLKEQVNNNNEEITIIIYGVTSYSLRAVWKLKSKVHHIHLIAPDLPEFMSGNNNLFYRLSKRIDRILINKYLSAIDSYSLLTEYMKEKLMVGSKKWTLLEGIYENSETYDAEKENGFCFLYTGTLNARYGIMDLVSAFSLIQGEEFKLLICGYGDSLDKIRKAIEKDDRIKYLGIKSFEEIRLLQQKATFLVNPRHSSEEYTKYSFPSKTMEYLASGTPTIMCKLPGIPKEYYDHLIFFEDESIEGYKNTLVKVTKLPKSVLLEKAALAASFIKEKKNSRIQAKKVIELIRSC